MTDEMKAVREKYWSELTPGERIDRTRERVKRLDTEVHRLSRLVAELMTHEHGASGEPVISIDPYRRGDTGMPMAQSEAGDDLYF